jgi:hypothetical protein
MAKLAQSPVMTPDPMFAMRPPGERRIANAQDAVENFERIKVMYSSSEVSLRAFTSGLMSSVAT